MIHLQEAQEIQEAKKEAQAETDKELHQMKNQSSGIKGIEEESQERL